jgi:hypothetical protein
MHGQTRLSINNNDVSLYRVGSQWIAKVVNTNKEYEGFKSKKAAIAILTDLLPDLSHQEAFRECNTVPFEEELRLVEQQYKKERRTEEMRESFKVNDRLLRQYDEVDAFTQIALVFRAIGNYTFSAQNDDEARDRIFEHLEELCEHDGLTNDFASLLFDAVNFAVTQGLGWDVATVIYFKDKRLVGYEPQSPEVLEKADAIASNNIFRAIRQFPNLIKACDNYAQAHRCRNLRIWEN